MNVTLNELITRIDQDVINDYSSEQKARWIDKVNEHAFVCMKKPGEYQHINLATDLNREMEIETLYDEIYDLYVYSKINLLNNEIENYNNSSTLYNNAMYEYEKYLIREGYVNKQPIFKNIEI